MGRLRKTLLSGWALHNHVSYLAQHTQSYTPPLWYHAMQKVPPPQMPYVVKKKGEIKFPDDKLKANMEKHSQHAKEISKQGIANVPWWFERRPIDDAVIEVKQIMKQNPTISEQDAIKQWDASMEKRTRVRQREVQMIKEEALSRKESATQAASSKLVTALDSYYILQAIRDMQVESAEKKEQRLQEVAEQNQYADVGVMSNEPATLKGDLLDNFRQGWQRMSFKKSTSANSNTTKQQQQYQQQQQQESAALLDLNQFQYYDKELERRLHPTLLRKMAQAQEVENLVKYIMEIKRNHGPKNAVFSNGAYITPFDFVAVYVKAFDINKVSATSPDWGKDRQLYSGFIDGKRAYEVLKEQYEIFKDKFRRFMRMEQLQVNVSGVLTSVNLGFAESPFQDTGAAYASALDELGVKRLDFTPIVEQLKQYNWKNYAKLKEHQPQMEEFFYLLQVSNYLRKGALDAHKSVYAEFERKEDVAEAKRMEQDTLKYFAPPKKEAKSDTASDIFRSLFALNEQAKK